MAERVVTPVYAIATNIVSALGMNTAAHWNAVTAGRVGVKLHEDESLSASPFYASKLDPSQWQLVQSQTQTKDPLSPFEQLAIYSAKQALDNCDIDLDNTVLILSTTKGNIEWLGQVDDERLSLYTSADIISRQLGLITKPVVVSHACISGVVALQYGMRLLQGGKYKYAIVVGCDRFSRFVLSGFQSFQAIADEPCKPFDAERKGINLGEAAATIILSIDNENQPLARLAAGATSNDANHISGPSRTGEELAIAINRSLEEAGISASAIGMVSAHGTATLYNDEMEAKAFGLSGVAHAGVHSFKGYVGHTLGAAGILESAMIIEALQHQQLIPSPGFESLGVSQELHVTTQTTPTSLNYVLKTASGFGGCNATAVWAKV
ncbi:beta-ketoacyl-[acyl-carrier-protein] synthase family protein [Polluticoccus soli]|uniref:beta-ketoacyl-[acyl-carrier-protein] synthase family protein n=1 Tax=Polluticoccus soli TaxID=3034150 RepID=UPI0023E275C5|nr:beta-ketoacyl synthase N-terminal-like domain-containing protein [Flavipsychrobacter sp. JY13-12]